MASLTGSLVLLAEAQLGGDFVVDSFLKRNVDWLLGELLERFSLDADKSCINVVAVVSGKRLSPVPELDGGKLRSN